MNILQLPKLPAPTDFSNYILYFAGGAVVIALIFIFYLRFRPPCPGREVGIVEWEVFGKGWEYEGFTVEANDFASDWTAETVKLAIDDKDTQMQATFEKLKKSLKEVHVYATRLSETSSLVSSTAGKLLVVVNKDIEKYSNLKESKIKFFPPRRESVKTVYLSKSTISIGERNGYDVLIGEVIDQDTGKVVESGWSNDDRRGLSEIIPWLQDFSKKNTMLQMVKGAVNAEKKKVEVINTTLEGVQTELSTHMKALGKEPLDGVSPSLVPIQPSVSDMLQGVAAAFIGFASFSTILPKVLPNIDVLTAGAVGIIVTGGILWWFKRK